MIAEELLMNAIAVDNTTKHSDSIKFDQIGAEGNASVLLVSSAAGTITVSQQCSRDNVNWFDPQDENGAPLGQVITGLAVATTGKWIIYNPVFAPYIRFKVVEGGVLSTNVSLRLFFQQAVAGVR